MTGFPKSYMIQGREFRLPCEVRDASAGSASFLVDAAAARRLLPGPEFEVVELLPGRALLAIALIDYRDNDLGDYDEVSIALFARPRGAKAGLPWLGAWSDLVRGRLGVHILHLPVSQAFTCEAGRTIWGYPKTVERIELEPGDGTLTGRLFVGGDHALTLKVPRGGRRTIAEQPMTTYSYVEGAPCVTRAVQHAEGFGVRLGGAELSLGKGEIAAQLRSLGLPRRALMTTWTQHMQASFGAPEKL